MNLSEFYIDRFGFDLKVEFYQINVCKIRWNLVKIWTLDQILIKCWPNLIGFWPNSNKLGPNLTEFRPYSGSGMNRISKNELGFGFGIRILIEFGFRIWIKFQNPEFAQAYLKPGTSRFLNQFTDYRVLAHPQDT